MKKKSRAFQAKALTAHWKLHDQAITYTIVWTKQIRFWPIKFLTDFIYHFVECLDHLICAK